MAINAPITGAPTCAPSIPTLAPTRDTRLARSIRRFLAAIEPWYDWGTINTWRMGPNGEEGEGEVYRFELQWFGLHLGFQIGRTPKREG